MRRRGFYFPHLFNRAFLEGSGCGKLPPRSFQNGEDKTGRREEQKKINFGVRLSFGKKENCLLFSPKLPTKRRDGYRTYKIRRKGLWKTRWKKWKTRWETGLLFHKSGGKPGGKSEKMIPDGIFCPPGADKAPKKGLCLFTWIFLNGRAKHDTMECRKGPAAGRKIFTHGGACL